MLSSLRSHRPLAGAAERLTLALWAATVVEARRVATSCQALLRAALRAHAPAMLIMHCHHSYGRERALATLVFADFHTRPSSHAVVARASTQLTYGATVLEVARETLAALLADVDRQLGQEPQGPDREF